MSTCCDILKTDPSLQALKWENIAQTFPQMIQQLHVCLGFILMLLGGILNSMAAEISESLDPINAWAIKSLDS